jgi:imidazolonepropionase-like amidohydrolase
MATGNGGELLMSSDIQHPYAGDPGVIKKGIYADFLVVDGDVLQDIAVIAEFDDLKLLMKPGQICKNALE